VTRKIDNWEGRHVLAELREVVASGLHPNKVAIHFGYATAATMRQALVNQKATEALQILLGEAIKAELELLKAMWDEVRNLDSRDRFKAISKLLDRFERLGQENNIPTAEIRQAAGITPAELLAVLRPQKAEMQ
jgi:predicted phosphoribosyltransferase